MAETRSSAQVLALPIAEIIRRLIATIHAYRLLELPELLITDH